jgi:hypothetical protein
VTGAGARRAELRLRAAANKAPDAITGVAPRADPRYSPASAAAGDVGEWLKPAVC